MKNLEFQELSMQELEDVNGGFPAILIGLLVGLAVGVIVYWNELNWKL